MTKKRTPRPIDPRDPADEARIFEARLAFVNCLLALDPRARSVKLNLTEAPEAIGARLVSALAPYAAPQWLAGLLGPCAVVAVLNAVTGQSYGPAFRLTSPWNTRTARQAKRRRDDGTRTTPRDVLWYYRTTVKVPPDSISALAREYEQAEPGIPESRKTVREGIRRAKDLLLVSY